MNRRPSLRQCTNAHLYIIQHVERDECTVAYIKECEDCDLSYLMRSTFAYVVMYCGSHEWLVSLCVIAVPRVKWMATEVFAYIKQ